MVRRADRCFVAAFMVGLLLLTAAAQPLTFEVVSARRDVDQRTGQPIVSIRLSEQRPFAKLEAEKQVLRTMELRIDGTAILRAVIREPPYVGTLQLSGPEVEDVLPRIERAVQAGSRLELVIVD